MINKKIAKRDGEEKTKLSRVYVPLDNRLNGLVCVYNNRICTNIYMQKTMVYAKLKLYAENNSIYTNQSYIEKTMVYAQTDGICRK